VVILSKMDALQRQTAMTYAIWPAMVMQLRHVEVQIDWIYILMALLQLALQLLRLWQHVDGISWDAIQIVCLHAHYHMAQQF
jgi:hypothetical protein